LTNLISTRMSNTKNMDKSEFYQQLAAILDIEEVNRKTY